MSDKLVATIENGIAHINYEVNSRKKTKTILVEALCKAILAGTNTGKSLTFNPPGLRIQGKCGDRVIVGYEFPERVAKMPFSFNNEKIELESVFPWGMTFVEFSDTPEGLQWDTFYQFGLKGPLISLDNMMYVWPGSNVFQSHKCCIGNIKVPKIKSIEPTAGLPFLFYNGVSNNDLSDKRFVPFTPEGGTERISSPIELYRHLSVENGKNPKPFPYDIMINAKSLKSFLSERGYL